MVNMRADSPEPNLRRSSAGSEDFENFIRLDSNNARKSSSGEEEEEFQKYAAAQADVTVGLQGLAVRRCNISSDSNELGGGHRLEQEKRMRREIANCNERRRMQSINAGFQSLRTLLPRHDGEKMSKASILQQTADLIRSLQADKAELAAETAELKRSFDRCSSSSAEESPLRLSENATITAKTTILAPPKKRRRYINGGMEELISSALTAESSDEGVGMLSSDDTDVSSVFLKRSPKSDSSSISERNLEMEQLRGQLMELKFAFDKERNVRLVLEEELRKRNIPSFATAMAPLVSSNANNYMLPLKHTVESLVTLSNVEPATYYANSLASSVPSVNTGQSLEVIVEAIRHLEGDQFVASSYVNKGC